MIVYSSLSSGQRSHRAVNKVSVNYLSLSSGENVKNILSCMNGNVEIIIRIVACIVNSLYADTLRTASWCP